MSYAIAIPRTTRRPSFGRMRGTSLVAGLGELVTPDNWFWSPGAIRAWLDQINEQIRSLGNDINERRSAIMTASGGPRFITDFEALRDRWLRFNHDVSSWWGNTVSAAQEYVNAYNALETRYRTITGSVPTTYSHLSAEEAPSALRSANYALMGWAVIGIVGIVGLGYLLNNYAKVKTLSKLTFNRRHRRSRRRR
jgi:hypothetical protein